MTPSEVKAKSRVVLLSTLSPVARGSAIRYLTEIAKDNGSANVLPDEWCTESTDTLVLALEGRIVGGVVFKTAALVDPLVLAPDAPFRAILFEFLMYHMQGILLGRGATDYVFGAPSEGLDDWKRFLTRNGKAHRLSSDKVDFFHCSIGG